MTLLYEESPRRGSDFKLNDKWNFLFLSPKQLSPHDYAFFFAKQILSNVYMLSLCDVFTFCL